MSLLFEFFRAYSFGLMAFIIIPVLASLLPWEYAKKVIVPYQKQAMAMLKGGLFLNTGRGLRLKKTKRDTRYNAEKLKVGGQWKYFEDRAGLMGRLYGYPVGIADERRNTITDARTLYAARRFLELYEDERLRSNGHLNAFVGVDGDATELVHPADIVPVVQKSASPGLVERSETFTEKGQALFNSTSYRETAEMLIYLGASFGMMWIASQAAQTGAGDIGSTLPIFLGWF